MSLTVFTGYFTYKHITQCVILTSWTIIQEGWKIVEYIYDKGKVFYNIENETWARW